MHIYIYIYTVYVCIYYIIYHHMIICVYIYIEMKVGTQQMVRYTCSLEWISKYNKDSEF